MAHFFENIEPSSSFLNQKIPFNVTETQIILKPLSTYLHNKKVSTANSSLDNNQITSTFITQFSDPTPQTINQTTFHPTPPSLCIIYFHYKFQKTCSNQQH